jgi:hypothetical protein
VSAVLRPSNLPKLAICACFEPNPIAGEAAARGGKLDGIFRRRIIGDSSDETSVLKDDLDAIDWATNTLRAIAGTAHIIADEERCRIECLGLTGTADAWIPELGMSADLKTGQFRNYREQMAAYALGFMEATFRMSWTVHLLFCDQRQLVTHQFTYAEAKAIVSEVIARYHDFGKEPVVCEYCSWCSKAETCPARLQLVDKALVPAASDATFNFELVLADNEKLGAFLTACSVLEDFREGAEEAAKKRLVAGDKIPGWALSSRKGAEFIYHDAVGRYIDRFGFGAVLAAYGNMSGAKFRQLWTEKMPSDAPFPEDLIQRGSGSVSLRRVQAKTAPKSATQLNTTN